MVCYDRDDRFRTPAVDLILDERAQRARLNSPADLRPLGEMLETRMRLFGFPGKDLFAVRLALEEAVTNAFRHGHRGDPDRSIHVRYLVTVAEVLLEVEDQGPGFDPGQVPDPLAEENLDRPSGRGLFLMRAYMTWMSFNPKGNRVTLVRQRSDP
jgi:serine/threonine-protein kinase RsbW